MIVVRLIGGLGNQMFQYATGRRLADKLGTQLYLDRSWFQSVVETDTPRFYELDVFKNSEERFVEPFDVVLLEPDEKLSWKRKALLHTKNALKPKLRVFREKGHGFNKEVLDLPDNSYLDGYWQSEKYFLDRRSLILEDFSFAHSFDKVSPLLESIKKSSHSVSLHVRRGDYVSNKNANKYHGTVSVDYYKKAVSAIAEHNKELEIFVFSDDPAWCKKNLKFPHKTNFVESNAGPEDMHLMSRCRHNIIANSSFSWWGAWLNTNKNKMVIAPKTWVRDPSVDTSDVVPKNWIRL